ncbi:tRNA pseudouridine(38-40) synthase TruA [Sulfurimonas sp.]|uniref:tRNA pseudouridine(38-40) synthase TruA n=1 Tax=Sulfurimonas sp. TaxID=2022749 RepID=UPI0025DDBAD8|nr:tRNA pseudouridine(38-40) synthase TruA [Sulfurimonas sp.]
MSTDFKMRVALVISYNGTHFFGSQIQTQTQHTIVGQLTKVLLKLGMDSKVIASGRTDKGVHATGQVCHIDLPEFWTDTHKLKRVLNEMLPSSIHVRSVKATHSEFHARYSAQKRIYRYIIKESESNPFQSDFITYLETVNFQEIQENIKLFCGEHDFEFFMKTGSDIKTTRRVIYKAFAYKYKGFIVLNFEANGFLRSQIRLMVGALLALNTVKIDEKLNCKINHKLKPAPPNGLYLAKIKY